MALLETGIKEGQILQPTTGALFRQRSKAAPIAKVGQPTQPVAAPTVTPTPQATTPPLGSTTIAATQQPASTSRIATQAGSKQLATKPGVLSQATPGLIGEQYSHQYQQEATPTQVLDKNYYKDLGFSTSKEKAQGVRESLNTFNTQVAEQRADIGRYEGEVETARTALDEAVDNAWENVATEKIVFGNTTWEVPPEMAEQIAKGVGQNFIPIRVPPAGDMSLEEYQNEYKKSDLYSAHPISGLDMSKIPRGSWSGSRSNLFAAEDEDQRILRLAREIEAGEPTEKGGSSAAPGSPESIQNALATFRQSGISGVGGYNPAAQQTDEEILQRAKEIKQKEATRLEKLQDTTLADAYKISKNQLDGAGGYTFPSYSGRNKEQRDAYYQIVAQISPQITKAKIDYQKEVAKQSAPQYERLTERQVEAKEAEGVLQKEEAEVKGEVRGVQESQAAKREDIGTTLGSLFRQRGR